VELGGWSQGFVSRMLNHCSSQLERRFVVLIQGGGSSYNLLLPLHYLYLSYLSELLSLPPYQEGQVVQHGSPSTSTSGLTPLPSSRLPNGLGCELISARIVKSDMTGALLRGESIAPVRISWGNTC
jgi:hypothetical protein